MKTLYLLRHANASGQDEALRDFDRPLTKRGIAEAEFIGKCMDAERLRELFVISSPAVRACETVKVLRRSEIPMDLRFDATIYDANVAALLNVLIQIKHDKNVVMLVGHNPGMEALLRCLTGEIHAMRPAALARLRLENTSWEDINAGEVWLDWLITPKDILD